MDAIQEDIPLEFSELCRVAGVPKTIAQNWTNGRPLKIQPSVAQAEGKGGRNIFSIYDAYLLAYLYLVRCNGLSMEWVKELAFTLTMRSKGEAVGAGPKRFFRRDRKWLAFSISKLRMKEEEVHERPGLLDGVNLDVTPLGVHDIHEKVAIQIAVNINQVRNEVDARALRFLKRKLHVGR